MDFSIYLNRIEKELILNLPSQSCKDWSVHSFGELFPATKDSHISPLLTPTRNLVDLGGKRWRPLFLVLCTEAVSFRDKKDSKKSTKDSDNAFHLTPLVEFVHTASLLHDDIEDSSDTRRGQKAAYLVYGLDATLNAASWLYFQAPTCIDTSDLSPSEKNSLYQLYTMETRRLHLGQAMDIDWHRNKNSCPTQDEYLAMVMCKTGTLSSMAAKIGCMVAGDSPDNIQKAGLAASKIGAGFQIIDDVINLTTGNPGKKRGDDIVEGKKSLPVLNYLNKFGYNSTEASQLSSCFEQASKDGIESPAVEKAIGLLQSSGAIDQAAKKGCEFIAEACGDFEQLFGLDNPFAAKIKELFTAMIPTQFRSI